LTRRFLKVNFEAEFGDNWNASAKEITLVLHNINWSPKKIKVARKRKRILPENNVLKIPVKWNPKQELTVKISLK
jgi:oligosaccharide 4-alpha-D-glucosyltransferase